MTLPAWFNDNSIPVVVTDDTGIIREINTAFEKAFAWNRGSLVGLPVTTIIPSNLRDAHHMGFSRYLLSGISSLLDTDLDLEILKGTGETVLARHRITVAETDGSRRFMARIEAR